jgi:hypothetical protein
VCVVAHLLGGPPRRILLASPRCLDLSRRLARVALGAFGGILLLYDRALDLSALC